MEHPIAKGCLGKGLLALLLTSAAGAAYAQEAQTPSDGPVIEEVIVTAAKRSENLQKVPISVSAITGDALAKGRVTQVDDLATRVPNLQLSSTVGDNAPIFALRGVSMADFSLNQSSPVATYYDEVYKGNFALLGVSMFDLERIEVLRGPQGTLYGKNTTGGAVNLITRMPKLGQTTGNLSAGYGNYDRVDLSGAINLPLGEKTALRIAGTYAKADGWFENVLPGKPDLQGVKEFGLRATLLFEPTDKVQFILRGSTSYQNPWNYGIYAQPEAVNRPGLGKRQIASDFTHRREARTNSVSLTGKFDVTEGLTVTSITSWDKGRLDIYEDTDGQGIKLLEIPYHDRAEQIAQDLRLTSDLDGPFNFIVGAYYNREKVFNETTLEIGNDIDSDGVPGVTDADCAIGFPVGCQFDNSFDQVKTSVALYTDMRFNLTEALTLRGGLRYTHDNGKQKNARADAFGANGVLLANLIPPSTLGYATDNVSGKIGLDYKLANNVLLYGNYSRGYRGRSFNAQAFFDPSELTIAKPETVDAFEAGAKTQFADRRVTLNTAAFYYKYKNQQFINVDPLTAAQTLRNIPRSRIMGGEIELTARATERLTFRGGLGLLDSKIEEGVVSGVDVAGNKLANAPAVTLSAGADATVVDGDHGKLSLHGDLSYSSSQFFEVLNIPRLKQDGYALLSAHLDWESPDGRWNASIWGKNLTDKFYFTSRIDLMSGFGLDYNHVDAPRTFGVTVGYNF